MIREVQEPAANGPANAIYALQRALRQEAPSWLSIGGRLAKDEIPWFWSSVDKPLAVHCENERIPYVLGPCVLFADSRMPGVDPTERKLLSGRHCLGMVTESHWYAELIHSNLRPSSGAAVTAIPCTVWPMPDGPKNFTHDLLVFRKSGHTDELVERLKAAMSCVVLTYGSFKREQLYEAARPSRACVYLSDDDRGPQALAEILLAGCPAVGIPRGAPWIVNGVTGQLVESLEFEQIVDALKVCHVMPRNRVRSHAMQLFNPREVADQYIRFLDSIRDAPNGR
jgi:hypothetical protein